MLQLFSYSQLCCWLFLFSETFSSHIRTLSGIYLVQQMVYSRLQLDVAAWQGVCLSVPPAVAGGSQQWEHPPATAGGTDKSYAQLQVATGEVV
jgi:hypothetical protein